MAAMKTAQEAFDATMMAMSEVLQEVNPEVAKDFAKWNLEISEYNEPVARFSTSYAPDQKFEVVVYFAGQPGRHYEADLSPRV